MIAGRLHEEALYKQTLAPDAYGIGTFTGAAIDRLGYDTADFVIETGAFAVTGDIVVKIQHDPASGGAYADVTSAAISADENSDAQPYVITVDLGPLDRYIRAHMVVADAACDVSVLCVLYNKHGHLPVTQDNTVVSV